MKKAFLLTCICPILLFGQPQWVCFTGSDGISDVVFDNQNVWTAGKGGLSVINQSTGLTENFNSCNAPMLATAKSVVARSTNGTIWAGSEDGGLVIRKPNNTWTSFSETSDGLRFRAIYEIFPVGLDKAFITGLATDWATGTHSTLFLYENGEINRLLLPTDFSSFGCAQQNLVDAAGNFWTSVFKTNESYQHSIARWDGSAWTIFGPAELGGSYQIGNLAQTPDGKVWGMGYLSNTYPANQYRLFEFDGPELTVTDIPNPNAANLNSLFADALGNLWISSGVGTFLNFNTAAGSWSNLNAADAIGFQTPDFQGFNFFKVDADGGWWFSPLLKNEPSMLLYSFKNGVLKKWNNLGSSAIPTNQVREVTIGPDKQKYMLGASGLLRFDPKNIGSEWTEEKLAPPISPVEWQYEANLKFDKQGNQWFTENYPNSSYLVKFDGQQFTKFQIKSQWGQALWLGYTYFDVDAEGHVWLPAGDFLIEMEPSGNLIYHEPAGPNGPIIGFDLVYRDPSDVLWALGDAYWFQKKPDSDWELKARFDALNHNFSIGDGFADLIVDKNGVAWFTPTADAGTGALGFWSLDGNDLQLQSSNINQPNTGILADAPTDLYSFAVDSSNNLWGISGNFQLPGNQRLLKFDGQNWTAFTLENSGFPGGVNHLAVDSFQNIWMSGISGLTVFNENGVKELGFLPDSPDLNEKLGIWPNPMDNETTIKLPDWLGTDEVDCQVFDISGRPVFHKKEAETSGILDLKTDNWPTGVFRIEVATKTGRTVGRLVKQ